MTWNIHGAVGPDRVCDLERVAGIVERHAPDVVALQEVDSRRLEGACAFESLAGCLGDHIAEARLISVPDGDYGHVLISRWPFENVRIHPLSVDGREPRAAIEADVLTPAGPLHVVAAHLGLSFSERRHQGRLLAELAASPRHSTVMMGDFNDWVWRGSVRTALADALPTYTPYRTFPSWFPMLKLDRIYCRPHGLMTRHWSDPDAWRASDHLPVIAELDAAQVDDAARSADARREELACAV